METPTGDGITDLAVGRTGVGGQLDELAPFGGVGSGRIEPVGREVLIVHRSMLARVAPLRVQVGRPPTNRADA